MTPAETYDDHARRPRNLGKLAHASAVGDVGSILVGDALRFYLQIDSGRISAARFQVFNATGQVAASSLVTEVVVGRTLDEARALRPSHLCAHLGDLDATALPPQPWAIEALRAALDAYQGRETVGDADRDALLCRCFDISEQTVRQAIAITALGDVDAVVAATRAGSGCGSCRVDIHRLLVEAKRGPETAAAPAPAAGGVAGRIALMHRIQHVVDERFLPAVRAAGGDVELWDLDGQVLRVRVLGALVNDDAAQRARLAELEALLKAEIDPTLGVAAG